MKCVRCQKEMDRDNPEQTTIKGITVELKCDDNSTPETIKYYNEQLGKYSDGKGGCYVAICYECYIDTLFHVGR